MLGEERRRGGTPGKGVMQVVLDASDLLAYLRAEPGSEAVDGVLGAALITSVNGAEVLQKTLSAGVEPFSAGDADTAALLWPQTRNLGLSLADRACLSLPLRIQLLR